MGMTEAENSYHDFPDTINILNNIWENFELYIQHIILKLDYFMNML